MKAFKIIGAEQETVAANTNIEALKFYCEETAIDLIDFSNEDSIEEIPESEWDNFLIENTERSEGDQKYTTLSEEMKGLKEPTLICSTVY